MALNETFITQIRKMYFTLNNLNQVFKEQKFPNFREFVVLIVKKWPYIKSSITQNRGNTLYTRLGF